MTDTDTWSPTTYVDNGDVELAYDRFGERGGVPLLLMMGLAISRFWWPDGFCRALADQGFDVVRYDQRDTGASTRFSETVRRGPWNMLLGPGAGTYTAADLADDAVAVLDAVGWDRAVMFGHSLGGVAAQRVALRHPDRVRALVSCDAPPSDAVGPRALRYLRFGLVARNATKRYPEGRDGDIAASLAIAKGMASPANPCDEAAARERIERGLECGPRDMAGIGRQLRARWRGPRLREIQAPTLVLQGEDDPLIRTSAARAVAREIRGAKLVVLDGIGHDLPPVAWPAIAEQTRGLVTTSVGAHRARAVRDPRR
ncbi:alpha/beta fold hydrolase [Promicromonospora umidemergens]|uniref:alpha/beta fold hydrolase n=1 Tax=Promicromonospora umidemergens TaxID=629679 RepID=UPI0020A56815|nr:alpha/beta hydrolase [Promicromonospora umidemergens]